VPISEELSATISEETAAIVRGQAVSMLRHFMGLEAKRRGEADPGGKVVPWDLTAGAVAGALGGILEVLWSAAGDDASKEGLAGMVAKIAVHQLAGITAPPGSFLREIEASAEKISEQRRKMT
jgi:hypothetical protein